MLSWASRLDIFCFLDSHEYSSPAWSIGCILAAGATDLVRSNAKGPGEGEGALDRLADFMAVHEKEWLFGHFGYGLVKETEGAEQQTGSGHMPGFVDPVCGTDKDPVGFPDLFFFIPQVILELSPDTLRIGSGIDDHALIWQQINDMESQGSAGPVERTTQRQPGKADISLEPRITREAYLATVEGLRQHILRGDCYEINFCQEFFSQPARIDPLSTWWSLSHASPNPFAAFYRVADSYLLCASPERYLKRQGDILLSQPIKGTWPRKDGMETDQDGRDQLYYSAKDRSENVMVVDLVRNDLSRLCRPGTVEVAELYGIYSFPRMHQMISSIKGILEPGKELVDCIRASFPMGSMTGAPKNRVVRLIQEYEQGQRGIFSGAVGYVTPEGDFDFNVVIRSILYNKRDQYLSYQVGSGITFYSDPVAEYEECLLKAEGIKKALE